METLAQKPGKARYAEYDRISIPEDVPALGVRKGNEGVIHSLDYHNETVYASVLVTYSTNQPRGWIGVQVAPKQKVSSYTGDSLRQCLQRIPISVTVWGSGQTVRTPSASFLQER